MHRVGALLRRRSSEAGYTLTELVAVLAILLVVLTGLSGLLVSGTIAQVDMTQRFQAQQNARLALDRLRREVHCASAIAPAGSATSTITMTLPSGCRGGTGQISWCALPAGSGSRYALYRSTSDPCDSSDKLYADYLTTNALFTHTVQSSESLGLLSVSLPVDIDPTSSRRKYMLQDDLVMRNTERTCISGSPSPPC
jgi:prepilin-type N-terminal cleavage/methylation domain-containing protein